MHVDVQDQMVHQSTHRYTYPGTLVFDMHGQKYDFPLYMFDSFIESVMHGTKPLATVEEAYEITRIIEAVHHSIAAGRPVVL